MDSLDDVLRQRVAELAIERELIGEDYDRRIAQLQDAIDHLSDSQAARKVVDDYRALHPIEIKIPSLPAIDIRRGMSQIDVIRGIIRDYSTTGISLDDIKRIASIRCAGMSRCYPYIAVMRLLQRGEIRLEAGLYYTVQM